MSEDRQESEALLQRLREGLDRVEQTVHGQAEPSYEQIRQWTADAGRVRRRRLVLDLLAFWCVAAILFFGGTMVVWRAPLIFVIVQVFTVAVGIVILSRSVRRGKEW